MEKLKFNEEKHILWSQVDLDLNLDSAKCHLYDDLE